MSLCLSMHDIYIYVYDVVQTVIHRLILCLCLPSHCVECSVTVHPSTYYKSYLGEKNMVYTSLVYETIMM